ncbi:hypothetical protein PV05_03358 [Exophiala xenobiotica]|uniref:Uncharacterized protein n=1 Tax=Exophiala xenobiotica TaxID=348802 RepID=A0A0D2EVR8_9EURO|nr:uncharacterized protein PV05_03358 [Exophiala xenobiotica]KIW58865.1 hypothetical protein PV05_03358 [Exophiala xenobiotica]
MERIIGANLEQIKWDKSSLSARLVPGLNAIHSITSKCPGPISGGEAPGSLWSEDGAGIAFPSIEELETYLNEKLAFFGTGNTVARREPVLLSYGRGTT